MRAVVVTLFGLVALVSLLHALPLDSTSSGKDGENGAGSPTILSRERRTIGQLRELFPNFSRNVEENTVSESKRGKREAEGAEELEEEEEEEGEEDLEPEATGDNDNEVEEDDADADSSEVEDETEDPRNKRFLNFGRQAPGGSAAGSGNFIFDIIRLIAGSGSSAGGAAEAEAKFGVGVPGPLTRLFVIANRGVANLIQDLMLRLAQTSERIVNFKARLITALI